MFFRAARRDLSDDVAFLVLAIVMVQLHWSVQRPNGLYTGKKRLLRIFLPRGKRRIPTPGETENFSYPGVVKNGT